MLTSYKILKTIYFNIEKIYKNYKINIFSNIKLLIVKFYYFKSCYTFSTY